MDEPPSGSGSRQCGQSRQQHVEQSGVFRGEQAGEPAVGGVVDGEARLHAGEPLVAGLEGLQREAQLIGFRPILGVVDGDEGAARQWQRDVQRLRLGARPDAGGDHDLERRASRSRGERLAGLVIVGFEDELDVELFRADS